MVHQSEKEREVRLGDTFLIERQEIRAFVRMQHVVGVFDTFGDTLVGQQGADVVCGKELFKLLVGYFRVDGHGSPAQTASARGSLNCTDSRRTGISSTVRSKRERKASMTSSTSTSGALAPAVRPTMPGFPSAFQSMSLAR